MSDQERQHQRLILQALNKVYPAKLYNAGLRQAVPDIPSGNWPALLKHLDELGYITAHIHISSDGANSITILHATITAQERDYLKDDGGLTAERDVVTVRLHVDTIRDLIVAQIAVSDASESVKAQLISQVKSLPAKGLEGVVTGLAREGMARLPNAIQWLQTTLSAVS